MNNRLEKEILLETLSFYEWMNLENILIGIDPKDLVLIESMAYEDLHSLLDELVKEGHLELKLESQDERFYKRTLVKKKSLLAKILK